MEIFKEVVEKKIAYSRGRVTRLLKYTSSEAKHLIKHCNQEPPCEGYETALELLKFRYGDPCKVSPTYRKEIIWWPTKKQVMHNHLNCFTISY